MSDEHVPSRARRASRLMLILVALNTCAYLDRSIIFLAVPQLQRDLHLTQTEVGVIGGFAFVISFVVIGLPCGWLVDRFSRRFAAFVGAVVWSLGASAGGLAQGFWQLFSSRVVVGAGESVLNPAAYSLIADVVPRKRLALALSVYGAAAGLGAAISVAGGGILLGYAIRHGDFSLPLLGVVRPWQLVLLITGIPGLLLAPLIFCLREPMRRDRLLAVAAERGAGLWRYLRTHATLYTAIFAGFSVLQILSYSFSSWEPKYLVQRFGWDISAVGVALSAGMLLSFVGAFAAGHTVDAMAARGVSDAPLRWSGTVALSSGLLIAIAFLLPNAWACVILVSLAQIPLALIGILSTALQQVTPNEYRGRISALFLLFGNAIGFGFGPLLPAFISDHVFSSEASLGSSVSIVAGTAGVLSAMILWSGCAPLRRGVHNAQRWMSSESRAASGDRIN